MKKFVYFLFFGLVGFLLWTFHIGKERIGAQRYVEILPDLMTEIEVSAGPDCREPIEFESTSELPKETQDSIKSVLRVFCDSEYRAFENFYTLFRETEFYLDSSVMTVPCYRHRLGISVSPVKSNFWDVSACLIEMGVNISFPRPEEFVGFETTPGERPPQQLLELEVLGDLEKVKYFDTYNQILEAYGVPGYTKLRNKIDIRKNFWQRTADMFCSEYDEIENCR